jgi:hypothetical protein
MAIGGLTIVGRPYGVWPATLQVMPEGILDTAFGRFFVGIRVSNTSAQAWPATEVRLSPRGRRILGAAGMSIGDGWSTRDAAAVAQTAPSEWIPLAALAAGAVTTVFFKLDTTAATPGTHPFELELRDPQATSVVLRGSAPLLVSRTVAHGTQRSFVSTCEQGTLTTAVTGLTVDQEGFRRAVARARAQASTPAPGVRTPAETERLRGRLRAVLCGDEPDVCSVLADLTGSCAIPTAPPPGPPPVTGPGALAIFSDQSTSLADRTKIADGSIGSNHTINIGNDSVINADINAGGNVVLGDRTRVQGNVTTAGTIQRGAGVQITGAAREHGPFASMTIGTKPVSPGSDNVTVNSGQGTSVSPFVIPTGQHGTFTINSNNVISMSAGTYQYVALIINADVELRINQTAGVVDFRVQSNLQFGDKLKLVITQPASGPLTPLFYSNQVSTASGQNEARIGNDILSALISVTVPQGSLHVGSRVNLAGVLAAKFVNVDPDTGVARVPADDWLGGGASGLELLGYPTGLDYVVAYKNGYTGNPGPQAFGRVPWKGLVANAALLFDLGIPGGVAADLVATADRAVVGTVKNGLINAPATAPAPPPSSQAGSVDAAVAVVRGNRSLGFPLFSYLDAQPGEANASPVSALGGTIPTPGTFLTNADIDALIASGNQANLKVYKSGAGTGVTRGILSALTPLIARDDENGTLFFVNQLVIVPDAQAPAAGGKPFGAGDSGALWIQSSTNKVVGLAHGVGSTGALASRIQDVVNALAIQIA